MAHDCAHLPCNCNIKLPRRSNALGDPRMIHGCVWSAEPVRQPILSSCCGPSAHSLLHTCLHHCCVPHSNSLQLSTTPCSCLLVPQQGRCNRVYVHQYPHASPCVLQGCSGPSVAQPADGHRQQHQQQCFRKCSRSSASFAEQQRRKKSRFLSLCLARAFSLAKQRCRHSYLVTT